KQAAAAQQQRDTEIAGAKAETQAAIANIQTAYDQKIADLNAEAQRIREQYETEARKLADEADARVAELEPLKGYAVLKDAYTALRDKQLLEQAAAAMRNIIDGYGDRYVVPTHSVLDDLAVEFGYDAAGVALKSAREQSRRMVEQGEAAACDYVEVNRRDIAIRFAIDAFNGRVDAILSRAKNDNYGTLEQEIRDTISLVNLNGKAF